jgi:putative CocE/NonD family hydrolase
MRPRAVSGRLPALLNFSIYADTNHINEVRLTAAHGYAGVGGLTRGKGCSPDQAVPIEHDGADAAALIEWTSRQPWSDGRVGMYGGSYDGFTQWAAAKRMPPALKAMMPSVTFAPGIDCPRDGNVFMNYAYPWPFYTTDVKGLDDSTHYDAERWNRLNHDWYVGGRAYRDLDRIDGTRNPFFDRWLEHPGYDAYWQAAIPYQEEFARIHIRRPTTTSSSARTTTSGASAAPSARPAARSPCSGATSWTRSPISTSSAFATSGSTTSFEAARSPRCFETRSTTR